MDPSPNADIPSDADRGERLATEAEYWRAALAGAPELLELPTDRPRPARWDHAGATVPVELDEALTAALDTLARRHGATPSMTVLAGWAVVLSRLSGQDDIVVGTPLTSESIGTAADTLPLRVGLSGAPTVAELLGRVRARALEARRHADLPFEKMVERVRPAVDPAHAPVFQVMLAWRETPGDAAADGTAELDLALDLAPRGGRIAGTLTYAAALFDRATAERHVGYLRRVLEEMAADERRSVDRLALMPESERARVVEAWNRTEAAYPRECIHRLFERQVERTPDATALVVDDERLSYAALNARANRLAHHLRALGVGPDARVAVCVERGVEMVIALLAALKAGGAYVPLDPSYPDERLRYMLADSRPAVLLASPSAAARLAAAGVPVLDPADAAAWAHRPDTDPRPAGLSPDHLCYVIYTSGSTGRPKGVAVPHRGVASLLADVQRRAPLREGDGCSLWTRTSFDVSAYEIFSALLAGGRLCIPRDEARMEAGAFLDWMEANDVRGAYLPPYFLPDLRARAARSPGRIRLRRLLVGVEPIPEPLLAEIRRRVPGLRIVNGYGPTETTICATLYDVPGAARGERAAPIGPPAANTRVFVLDARMRPVPIGVAGELYVGGAGVARGYLDRPALTAERFVPDPLSGEPGARLYRTGDLGRWLPEGVLEFAGRTDAQVKVRGYRIELGEVEARLAEHSSVREAAVVARDDGAGGRRLVAYCVAEGSVDAEQLRAHLAARLPEHMVPAAIVRLDAFPRTPSGKIDRRALPAPGMDAYATRGYEAPADATETALAEIWAEVLGVERVGRHDHFLALGGHSLLAVRAASRVRRVLGVESSPGDLFDRPVLADFARGLATAAHADAAAIPPADRTAPIPASLAQQRLWFLEQLGGTGAAYHVPIRLRLRGALDRGALVRALDRIVARHEALRTTFPAVDGEPVQRIAPAGERAFRLVEHDLHALPDAEDALRRLARDEAAAPFDLAHGPLLRGRLVRMGADDHVLLLTMHHVVSDGWSAGVLHRELGVLYAAFARGDADPLPPLAIQFADYAAWHRRRVESPAVRAQAEYWAGTLADAPELLELPADRPRPARQDFAGASVAVELDEALTAALKTLSRRHGATLFMTVLAGWAAVLARLSGQDDVVVGTPSAGRGRAEVEALIGFFVNTLALRIDLAGSPSAAALLGRVRSVALEAQRHQDVPFERVVERVRPARTLAHTPVFQVMLAWQEIPGGGEVEMPGITAVPLDGVEEAGAPFDLLLDLAPRGGRIAGTLTYATALFDRATVERHAGYLRRVLEGMAADDAAPVDGVEILSAAERRRVVEACNATGVEFPPACVHDLFRAQAARTPDAVAVSWRGEARSYAALEARANRLAHHLRARGVGPEVRVGVCLPRTPELIVALLAVLKAGGAYVPLDPAQPAARLGAMLEDAEIPLVLTESRLADRLPASAAGVLLLDHARAALDAEPAEAPRTGVAPENVSHVIFTSGSTGRPKGVMIRHSSVVARLHWLRENVSDEERSAALFSTSASFDVSVAELFGTLCWGGRLVLVENALELATVAEPVACASMVPTAAAELLRAGGIPASVRSVNLAGEALPPALAQGLYALGTVRTVRNLYGPTEDTTYSTGSRVEPGAAHVLIGRPLANTRAYVLDARLRPVPEGVAGELYLAGDGLARGYAARPGLTAERFLPCPFGPPGARMYRTMDRARWKGGAEVRGCEGAVDPSTTEGKGASARSRTFAPSHPRTAVLEYLGRADFQVKVRGFRIEPGEIEARLREHPAVRDAVVVARQDAPGETRLVAYVVGTAAPDALRAHLAASLPAYMVPAAYVRLEALPRTSSGKLDRKALPAPDDAAYARRGDERPRGHTEEALAEIWAEMLGVERIGRRDHFFDLGGHSLLAARMVDRVRETVGPALTLDDLFAHPTLDALAARLDGKDAWLGGDHAVPVRAAGAERPLFLVHDVTGLVAYAQLLRPHVDAEIPLYALPGPLSSSAACGTMDDLVTRLVRMVAEVQPEGPVRLAGWSAGGTYAYAMAERLLAMGRPVAFVGMLDTHHPTTLPKRSSPQARHFVALELLARDSAVPAPTPEALRALREETVGQDLPAFLATCHARGLLPETVTVDRAQRVWDRIGLLRRTTWEFVPRPLPIPVHLFATDDEAVPDPRRGWRDLPGGAPIRVERVPGTHLTMMRKGNVEALGAALSRAIRASGG